MAKTCPFCGAANRDTARFCQACSQPLVRDLICPTCGAVNVPVARFCHQCGKALPSAGPASSHGTGLLPPNTLLNNRYLIIQQVGKGGMGAVYKAADTRLGQKVVAVKELSESALTDPQERQQARQAFEQEARMLAQLSHPNLPRVTDHFSEAGKQYLVMDFIEGQTLEQLLAKAGGPLDVKQVVDWAGQLCDVLEYLHSQQPPVIFRDLKPGNIMITPQGQVKLIDFGIARLFKPGKTSDTTAFGTAGYAPPEQYGKGQTDARSDIYALGATLHHLLTGRDPANDPFNFPPVRTLNSQISQAVEHAIMKAVERDAGNRWQSAREMKQALIAPTPPVGSAASASSGAASPYVAAPPAPAAPAVTPPSPAAIPTPIRPGFMVWLALAVGIYAVSNTIWPLVWQLEDPAMRGSTFAAMWVAPAILLYRLSRRPWSAILMGLTSVGLTSLAGAGLSVVTMPSTAQVTAMMAAAVAVELAFALAGSRKMGFWTAIWVAAVGGVAGWIALQIWAGVPLSGVRVDEDLIGELAGAAVGGAMAFLLAMLLMPSWWKSSSAMRGRFNYVQMMFIALASIAVAGLIQAPVVQWINAARPGPDLQILALTSVGGLALPLAFMIARKPGTAVLVTVLQGLSRVVAGFDLTEEYVLPDALYALTFELTFLGGGYRQYGFRRLILACALSWLVGYEASWIMRVHQLRFFFSASTIFSLAGVLLRGTIAYLIARLLRS